MQINGENKILKPWKAAGYILAPVLSKHILKWVRRSCSQLGSNKWGGLREVEWKNSLAVTSTA